MGDAMDWTESLARLKSVPIMKLLKRAAKEVVEKYNWDLARVYVHTVFTRRGFFVKSIRKHTRGRYGINKSPRNMFMVRLREAPIEEFFHKLYIYGKVPRSIASDMR